MTEMSTFQPDWASAPGVTLVELLESRGVTDIELADALGIRLERLSDILSGAGQIDRAIAEALADRFETSVEFWIRRESQYRESLARKQKSVEDADLDAKSWLRMLPVNDMIKNGWIGASKGVEDRMAACLKFFGASSIKEWQQQQRAALAVVAFRTTTAYETSGPAVSAWLRRGEILASQVKCAPWDRNRLLSSIPQLRRMTVIRDPGIFLPKLTNLCASCGIALVVAKALPGCRASGATKFLTDSKAMVQLSFRYMSDDQFWFTFFHEIGHLVLHGKDALFLEVDSNITDYEEMEANEYAKNTLIPEEYQERLLSLPLTKHDIMSFARELRIAPGIIVGQLEHHKRLPHNKMSALKRRYKWTDIPTKIIP